MFLALLQVIYNMDVHLFIYWQFNFLVLGYLASIEVLLTIDIRYTFNSLLVIHIY